MTPKFLTKIRNSRFFIRLLSWEYWPMHVVYTPIYLYWFFLGIRARAFLFFTGVNPGMDFGGFFGESKKEILDKIPAEWTPVTLLIPKQSRVETVLSQMETANIDFPVIAKPDVGERGFLVEKVNNPEELQKYILQNPVNFLIQEYVAYPEEVGVLYYRFPTEKTGAISSVTLKKFLSVTGDGVSSVRKLMADYPRAKLQLPLLETSQPALLEKIPAKGEILELVPIGNHSRGTTFLNGNHLIDEQMVKTFDQINSQLEGVFFGRFDIRCRSIEDLKQGQYFKILEVNGVKSEPTHIYEPGFSIWEAYRVLFRQWKTIYRISMANKALGYKFPSLPQGLERMYKTTRYKKLALKAKNHV
ncbi:MAG: hypothetical protein SF052_10630 [Bacteroidia bacterium]|nr:hypothetical protein [Bacteroidia bacterium]